MKTCFKCGVKKPLFDFYKHKEMGDGHLNKCKPCTKKDAYEHRHGKGRDRVLESDRARSKNPERIELRNKINQRWKSENPLRRSANIALGQAIKSGKVLKWPCCAVPECNKKDLEGHHPDYSKPLDVVWLCVAHHRQTHSLILERDYKI